MPFSVRPGLLLGLLLLGICAQAVVRLPAVLGENMVLQREKPIAIWGEADPGERVMVTLNRKRAQAVTGADGQWAVTLPAMKAGGPYTLTVAGANTLTVQNILIGEVWVCSGQSNMEWRVGDARDAEAEIATANYPQIRLYSPVHTPTLAPRQDAAGSWVTCSPATIPGFSAAGYFFGRELYRRLRVPIGLINAAQGGSTAEQWTPAAALKTLPDFTAQVTKMEAEQPARLREQAAQQAAWTKTTDALDPGYQGKWFDPAADTTDWKTMELPRWMDSELANFDGVVWFRRDIDVPAALAARPLDLSLGPVDDMDITWVNGVKVGEMMDEGCYAIPRHYHLPAGLVRAGRNTVVVRMLDLLYGGGLTGYPTELRLVTRDAPTDALSLADAWRYHTGFAKQDAPAVTFQIGSESTYLYNGIIAPLTRFPIRGAIWYQGESNIGRAAQYRQLLPAMIRSWRAAWKQGDFPFLIVQLPNLGNTPAQPGESAIAELREAQAQTLTEPHTGLVVTIDIGEAAVLHPKNKQDVGLRLALLAANTVYGQKVIATGPVFRELHVDGATLRVRFTSPGGLAAKGGAPLTGFAIAGDDHIFTWATAVIAGDSVLLTSPQVPHPVAVRYAWGDSPQCNLTNADGLPAAPFRTDGERK